MFRIDDGQLHMTGGDGTPAVPNPFGIILWQNAGELSVADAAGNVSLLSSHSNFGMLKDEDFHPLGRLKHTVTHKNDGIGIAQVEYNFLNMYKVAIGNLKTGDYVLYNEDGSIIRESKSQGLVSPVVF